MTHRQFQIELERRLQLIDPTLKLENKLSSDQLFSLLNESIDKFWKTRYSGINYKAKGFEQNQKRIDDLRTLVKSKVYTDTDITTNSTSNYTVTLPVDYNILLGDTVEIIPISSNHTCWEKDNSGNYIPHSSDTIESTIETKDNQLANSLSEHHLKYCKARPLRLISGSNITLFSDGQYKVSKYSISYLSKPSKLGQGSLSVEYTDLPESTHMEIVKIAVQLYAATIPTQNYNSYSNEVNTME